MQENNLSLAARGLKQMFLSQILAIIGLVCTVIAGIAAIGMAGAALTGSVSGTVGAAGAAGLFGIAAGVLSILSLIFQLLGLNKAGHAHEGFKSAFTLSIINLVLSVIKTFVPGVFGTILNVVSIVLGFLVVSHVCTSAGELLRGVGDENEANRGATVRTIYMVCAAVNVVCALLGLINALSGIASVLSGLSSIVGLVGLIIYMIFLKKSGDSLTAASATTQL